MRILAVQYKIQYLDVKANLRKIEKILTLYKHLKTDLAIFPEYALTGPLYSNYHLAFDQSQVPELTQLAGLAKKYRVNIIPGSFIRRENNKLLNSTCLITSDGQINGYYDKHHLWSSEKRFLTRGKENPLFTVAGFKISLQICADLEFPLLSHEYKSLKPDVIINVAMWAQEDRKACVKKTPVDIEQAKVKLLTRARAIENHCYVVFCNFGGRIIVKSKTGRLYPETSIGNSMVINPYGEIITKTTTANQEVLFCVLNKSKCHWSKF